jgi:hypothetical protein
MPRLPHLPALVVVTLAAPALAFPTHTLDQARGAAPLAPGELFVRAGVDGGVAMPEDLTALGLGAGLGIEGQISKDLAVGMDLSTGLRTWTPDLSSTPLASALTLQYVPAGWDDLAVRGSAGFGVDFVSNTPTTSPYLAGSLGVVASRSLGPVEAWVAGEAGGRQFLGGIGTDLLKVKDIAPSGLAHNTLTVEGSLGVRYAISDSLGVYGAGNVGGDVILVGEEPIFSPSVTGQLGVTFSFMAP